MRRPPGQEISKPIVDRDLLDALHKLARDGDAAGIARMTLAAISGSGWSAAHRFVALFGLQLISRLQPQEQPQEQPQTQPRVVLKRPTA